MAGHDIIVVGASAGGVEALRQLAHDLPEDLPAAVFVVLHMPAHCRSALPLILSRAGKLPATQAENGEPIQAGRLYTAPPDQHLLLHRGVMRLSRGPRENGNRPAVDTLFRTAARYYGPRVIGVILSGALDDGTSGLIAVKQQGGWAVVQDPEDALYPGMPSSALAHVAADHVLPIADIGAALDRLARLPARETGDVSEEMVMETNLEAFDEEALQNDRHPGTPSGFGCPDCGGALWELRDGELVRFRCRVGHAWGADSLLAAQSDALEEALWTALRALEERASLATKLAEGARQRGYEMSSTTFERQAEEARSRAAVIRNVLLVEKESAGETPAGDPSPPLALQRKVS